MVQERLRPLRAVVKLQALLASGVLHRLCRRRRRRRLLLVVGPNSERAILLLAQTLRLRTLWGQKSRGEAVKGWAFAAAPPRAAPAQLSSGSLTCCCTRVCCFGDTARTRRGSPALARLPWAPAAALGCSPQRCMLAIVGWSRDQRRAVPELGSRACPPGHRPLALPVRTHRHFQQGNYNR